MNRHIRNSQKKSFEEQLIDQAALKNSNFVYNRIQPSVFFWKQLISSSPTNAPQILVPQTLVLNQKDIQIVWIYTNPLTGKLSKELNTSYKDFIMKITNYTSPNQLVCILKRPIFHEKLAYVNEHKLLSSKFLQNSSQQQVVSQKSQVACLQKYIKCAGSKAFICRTIYEQNKAPISYLLTNKNTKFYEQNQEVKQQSNQFKKLITKSSNSRETNCIKSKTGTNLQQTLKTLKQIIRFMKFVKGVQITQIVGDFIKDQSNNWWLTNIKAFKIKESIKSIKNDKKQNDILKEAFYFIDKASGLEQDRSILEKQRYQKTKICRYCQKNYLQPQLTHKLTMKMIIQVDKYLVHMGKWDRWLKRSDITNVDAHCLYQQHKVCQRCYRLYSEIQRLMKIEHKFLKKVGCSFQNSPKQMIISQTNEEQLWNQSKTKQIHRLSDGIPQIIQLGPNTNITTFQNRPICNDQIINKMIRFRFIIYLNEIDQVSDIVQGANYYLQMIAFGRKTKYRLDLSLMNSGQTITNPKMWGNKSTRKNIVSNGSSINIIPLKKLKVLYFFANSMDEVKEYSKSGAAIQMNLFIETKKNSQTNKQNKTIPLATSQVSSFSKKTFKQSIVRASDCCPQQIIQRKNVGKLRLQIKDFITLSDNNSKKDFYKFFDVNGVSYGWGLEGSIGILPSDGYVNTSRIIFSKIDKEIYLPYENYYYCEYLPEEWINHIKDKYEKSKRYYTYQAHTTPINGLMSNKYSCSLIRPNLSGNQEKRKNRKPSAFVMSEIEDIDKHKKQIDKIRKEPRICFEDQKPKQMNKKQEGEQKKEEKISWEQFLYEQIHQYEEPKTLKKRKSKLSKNKQNFMIK